MADLKISELTSLPGGSVDAGDVLPIVHLGETKKVTVKNLLEGGFDDIDDGSLSSAKVAFQANAISTVAINALAVTSDKIAADAITAAKLADDSSAVVSSTLPAAGDFEGQLHIDSDDDKASYWNGSTWLDLKAKGSVNTVTGDTAGIVNLTATASGDTIALTTSLDNTSGANQFLAGPTNAAGAAGYRAIDPSDLPLANTSLRGAVIVNGNGLVMDAGVIEIDNAVAAEASPVFRKVAYNAQGLVTSSSSVAGADLPVATSVAPGAVEPGTGLDVDGSGVLNHTNVVSAATVSGITFDTEGHITNATALADSDIPNLPATKITTGSLDVARIADNTLTGAKIANYAITKIGDVQPTADQIGQFFFNPLTRDLFLWDGNVYQPIGISVGEIIFAGTFDASSGGGTGLVASVTDEGTAIGLVVGQALPAAGTANNRYYLVVSEAGTITSGSAPNVALSPPDIVLSNGNEWTEVDVSQTITSVSANQVSYTPSGSIAATNVQSALIELDNEKLAVAGGTMAGTLLIGDTGSLAFEGSTDNAFETTLAVTDPTADRTITLPDATGTVVLSGSIVNTDINASAAIAFSKLASLTSANILVGNGSNVATSVAVSGDITLSNAGVAAIASGAIVDADISASAEIAVSKLADGAARQVLQTDAAGTGVEWTDNLDLPGTLDVTGIGTFDAATRGVITALTDGATITPDFALANNFSVTLGGNRTLANPSNLTAGQSGCIWITQDGTGSRTLAYGSQWDFTGGTAPTLTTTAAAVDCLVYAVQSSTKITATLVTNLS